MVITSYLDEYKKDITEIYELDMDEKKLIPISDYKIFSGRAAGNFILHDNNVIRPIQKHTTDYGNAMMLYSYAINGNELIEEQLLGEITAENFTFDKKIKSLTGTHTVNRFDNIEVIDFKYERFCFLKRFIWFVKR